MIGVEKLIFYAVGAFIVLMIFSRHLLPMYQELREKMKPKEGDSDEERRE